MEGAGLQVEVEGVELQLQAELGEGGLQGWAEPPAQHEARLPALSLAEGEGLGLLEHVMLLQRACPFQGVGEEVLEWAEPAQLAPPSQGEAEELTSSA